MTKLEEKLLELGYRQMKKISCIYFKDFNKVSIIYIQLNEEANRITFNYISGLPTPAIEKEMEKDLEVLNYE